MTLRTSERETLALSILRWHITAAFFSSSFHGIGIYLVMRSSIGFGQPSIKGGLCPTCTAHIILYAEPPISSKGFFLDNISHRITPQLNTSHFSVYLEPSNTSGAIQAAEPLLLVIYVFKSQAVPKSQILRVCPPITSNRFGGFKSLKRRNDI